MAGRILAPFDADTPGLLVDREIFSSGGNVSGFDIKPQRPCCWFGLHFQLRCAFEGHSIEVLNNLGVSCMMMKDRKEISYGSVSRTSGESPSESSQDATIISESIYIKGEISGQEDLTIQGRVEGTIALTNNHVTVGKTGYLIGDLYGKLISVEGEVQGNLRAEEKINLLASAVVQGDMQAPVISLQEGAKFKGVIDMETGELKQRSQFKPTPSPGPQGD